MLGRIEATIFLTHASAYKFPCKIRNILRAIEVIQLDTPFLSFLMSDPGAWPDRGHLLFFPIPSNFRNSASASFLIEALPFAAAFLKAALALSFKPFC